MVAGIAGAAGGWAISQYCGSVGWIPIAATILLLLLFTKTPVRPKFYSGAIAVTGAHIVWFVVGSVIAGVWSTTALDIMVLSVGVVWLWLRPGLAPVLYLGIVQLGSLAINVSALSSSTYGDAAHRALTFHCVLRLAAIVCLIFGYIRVRKQGASVQCAETSVAVLTSE